MCYKDEKQKQLYEKLVNDFEKLDVPEFIQRYFVLLKSSISKVNYWTTIRSMLEYMIKKKAINRINIAEIQPEDFLNIDIVDIASYLEYLENKGMSSRSVYIRKNMLSSFWNYLVLTNRCPVENNIIKSVPYDFVTSNNNLVLKMPSEEQLLLMETRIKQKPDPYIRERNLTVFMILKGTGIRESELAGLDLTDIYLNGDENDHRAYIKVLGKKKYRMEEQRKVLLTESAMSEIIEWLKVRQTMENIIDSAALLLNKNGKRLNEDNIKKIFRNYGDGITPHMMRHWYATMMEKKFGVAFVQQQLGHSSMAVTVNNYTDGTYGVSLEGL